MPGYYIHYAACRPEARENLTFLRGVEAPDILKKHYKMYGEDGALEKYNSMKTPEMPEYDVLVTRIGQKEKIGSLEGLHYGASSQPGVWEFWKDLSKEDRTNAFYKGYFWHLLTDLLVYSLLDIDEKFKAVIEQNNGTVDIDELRKTETQKLHDDWDRLNARARDAYPNVVLSPEVVELGVVKFIEGGKFVYVEPQKVFKAITALRKFNPLTTDFRNVAGVIAPLLRKE